MGESKMKEIKMKETNQVNEMNQTVSTETEVKENQMETNETVVNQTEAKEIKMTAEQIAQAEGQILDEFVHKGAKMPMFIMACAAHYEAAGYPNPVERTVEYLKGYYREGDKILYGTCPKQNGSKPIMGKTHYTSVADKIRNNLENLSKEEKEALMKEANTTPNVLDKAYGLVLQGKEKVKGLPETVGNWADEAYKLPVIHAEQDDEKWLQGVEYKIGEEPILHKAGRTIKNLGRKARRYSRIAYHAGRKILAGAILLVRAAYRPVMNAIKAVVNFVVDCAKKVYDFFAGLFSKETVAPAKA